MGTGTKPRNIRESDQGYYWFYIPKKLFEYSGCNKSHILAVYACLAYHADKKQVSFPSQQTIASETGISERAVKTTIGVLKENNIIRVRRTYLKNKTRNKYLLVSPTQWIDQCALNAHWSGHEMPSNNTQGNNKRISKRNKEDAENTKILEEGRAKLIAKIKSSMCIGSP